jgi:putative heme transporter
MAGIHSRQQVACHHRCVSSAADASASPLATPPSPATRLAPRFRLDGSTFLAVVAGVLVVLAFLAVVGNSSLMLTRIGIGLLIALALDSTVNSVVRRLNIRRGVAVVGVGAIVAGIAFVVVAVLAPRAIAEVQNFSQQFPQTVGELERLPFVGGWIRDQDLVERAERWVADLPEEFTDERLVESARSLLSGVVSIAIVAIVTVAVLVDGENLALRFRRLLSPSRRAQADEVGRVMYETLGRYVGGSLTVAGMMGLFVLALGLVLGVPLAPLAAVWAMLTDLIPQIGGALGGVVFVALALTESVPTAIIAGALFVVYMTFENHVIQPAVVGRAVDLTAPTTMVAALVGGAIGGVPGALVATPLVGAAKHLILEARGRRPPLPAQTD